MNNKGILYLATFIILGITAAYGNPQNNVAILKLKLDRESPIAEILRDYYNSTPATMHFADTVNVSTAVLTADIDRSDIAVLAQNGKGYNYYSLFAETYYKLSPVSTLWGHAGYLNGKTLDIAFCDVINYETVAPFVLCDDAGGNLNSQRYDFGGGWSRCYNGIWSLGAQADYAATVSHRAVDPRVRNIVSDLNVVVGGARKVGQGYMLGLNLGVRVYNQDTDVDFYNTVTHAVTMVYTGLGTTSSRFRGADAQNSSHRMTGFNASLQLVPTTHGDRFYGDIAIERTNVDLILTGYNNLNFGTTTTTMLKAKLSRQWSVGQGVTLFPTISCYISNRVATENLFGSSAENYDKIGERQNYHHNHQRLMFEMPVSIRLNQGATLLTVLPIVGYAGNKEYLLEPARNIHTDCIIGGMSLSATKRLACQWAIGAKVEYAGRFAASTSAEWGGLDFTTPIGLMCKSNYSMSSCDVTTQKVSVTASRAINAVVASLSASLEHSDYKGLSENNRLAVGLSLTF
ncbi:MAG: hypothetical protein K2K94_02380 [Muribaculaceae bacterium]|nr:hypothetical protein [Muribaculaceae bacterium]